MTYINQLETLCQQCGCKMETEVSLAEHTTFRVGGPCRALVHVNSARTAQTLVQFLRRGPWFFSVSCLEFLPLVLRVYREAPLWHLSVLSPVS